MGLESYIFKTTKQVAIEKKKQILTARNNAKSKGVNCGGMVLFINDAARNYIQAAHPDIWWYKRNHITAWISERVFRNPKGDIQKYIGTLTRCDLLNLREDCRKVLEHCVLPNGKLNIDEVYCKQIFPQFNLPLSGNSLYDQYFIEEIRDSMNDIDVLLGSSNYPSARFIFYIDY